jgi:thiamine-phosphate pyrophosphorylase
MLDLRLYAIIDPAQAGGHALSDLATAVAKGGATLVQLRDKVAQTRTLVEEARTLKSALGSGIPLIINDRVDVVLASGADGVHVGQDDMAVEDARRLLGPNAIVGLSIKTLAQAEAAPIDLLDYVGIGGVFATTSKNNPDPPIGVYGLARIAGVFRKRAPKLPLVAIAGIDGTNAADVIDAGADGVAVISALSREASPASAAQALRGVVDAAIAKRGGA